MLYENIQKMFRFKNSFTLIELLVVVAIISLLATLIIVSISPARNKAKNTRIQTVISQIRTQAILIKNNDDSFVALCDASDTLNDVVYPTTLKLIEDDAEKMSSVKPSCYANDDAYCVQAQLIPSGYYCVDSTGYAGLIANCSDTNIKCSP